ncbi:MAG: hypothetical protein ABMA25_09540 [Ilumatobacteraceae bacterium]
MSDPSTEVQIDLPHAAVIERRMPPELADGESVGVVCVSPRWMPWRVARFFRYAVVTALTEEAGNSSEVQRVVTHYKWLVLPPTTTVIRVERMVPFLAPRQTRTFHGMQSGDRLVYWPGVWLFGRSKVFLCRDSTLHELP